VSLILARLGCRTRAAAVARASVLGVLQPDDVTDLGADRIVDLRYLDGEKSGGPRICSLGRTEAVAVF